MNAHETVSLFLARIPRDHARRHHVMPDGEGRGLLVAESTPGVVVHNIGVRLGEHLPTRCGDEAAILREIDRLYAARRADLDASAPATPTQAEECASEDLLATEGKGPVVQFVDALLLEAIARGASDVHVQPMSERALIRFRIDGVLHDVHELARSRAIAVTSRLKVLGGLDVAEARQPQDGRTSVVAGATSSTSDDGVHRVDVRISTVPTRHGERVALRLLDGDRAWSIARLDAIGMPSEMVRRIEGLLRVPRGAVIMTGPTGSGKSTTLYAMLRSLIGLHEGTSAGHRGSVAGHGLNIMTVEDPIEYELSTPGFKVSQTQVGMKKGMSFAAGLRHVLRQDPDVVMVGEIRDKETARMAMQASLTGHLVLSTLHTTSAVGAIARLVDLEVEPFLLRASLTCVVGQRLVRRLHDQCNGVGCDACTNAGFRGRVGVFEMLMIDTAIRDLIGVADASEILEAARRSGHRTLADEVRRLIGEGVTTSMEAERSCVAWDLEEGGCPG